MFRFTIRDVLWLTAVVGLAAGWAIDHFRFSPEDRALMQQIKEQRKNVEWQSYPPISTEKPSGPYNRP